MALTCRTEVLEYGHIPISPWLSHFNSIVSLQTLRLDLLRQGVIDLHGRCFVTPSVISSALDINPQQIQVLLDLLGAVLHDRTLLQRAEDGSPTAVDVYPLVLFLLSHYYTRDAMKLDTADIWPSDHPSTHQLEPSSPMRLIQALSKDQAHLRSHLPATRQRMQQYLNLQESLYKGFPAFLAKHASEIIAIIADPRTTLDDMEDMDTLVDPGQSMADTVPEMLHHRELNRLAFLVSLDGQDDPRQATLSGAGLDVQQEEVMMVDQQNSIHNRYTNSNNINTSTNNNSSCNRKRGDGDSDATQFSARLAMEFQHDSIHVHQQNSSEEQTVATSWLISWIKQSLQSCEDSSLNMQHERDIVLNASPSPPRMSMFDQLAPPMLSMLCPSDVHAVQKATVLRGQTDLHGTNTIRILDCHDAIIYCLAPLQYTMISCCTNCMVVLGAVGTSLRIERCERVQVIAAATSTVISTCHDCIFYLGTNRPPIFLGDNRYVQLAPHNTGYESLTEHMQRAGVKISPNVWSRGAPLVPDHSKQQVALRQAHHHHVAGSAAMFAQPHAGAIGHHTHHHYAQQHADAHISLSPPGSTYNAPSYNALPHIGGGTGSMLLPPGKLMPFLVPFRGGEGPLCGGAAPSSRPTSVNGNDDALTGLLTQVEFTTGAFAASPFPMPAEYSAAWEQKMAGVAMVRSLYSKAGLTDGQKKEFMSVVQSHFKEWLQSGGGMREVYDLAKVEKEQSRDQQRALSMQKNF